jgi:hypothetical protein
MFQENSAKTLGGNCYNWFQAVTFLLVFERCLIRIPARTPAILTEIFCCFPQCIQENSVAIPYIRPNRFLPYPLQFIIHCHVMDAM